jgi:cyanophycinase-like exopeptidase
MNRIAMLLLALACALPAHAGKKYSYDRVGAPDDLAPGGTTHGVVLMGGGTEVDSSMRNMCEWANGGDFLVIRAAGTDAYNPYLQDICPGLNSVATLVIPSNSAAADPFVARTILAAEAIWIAGGAQDDYINYWTGTPVQVALNTAISNGVPIGGTSAGLAVLTQYVYSALGSKGVTSAQALENPYNRYVTLASDFVNLPALAGIIGDTHFVTRDRMGRAMAFLCRITNEGWGEPRAIAVDEETALEIPAQGPAKVASNRSDGGVYFLSPTEPAEYCEPKTPLTFRSVDVHRVGASESFDLGTWTSSDGIRYRVSAESGVLTSTQDGGSVY